MVQYPFYIGSITLTVNDLDGMVAFYQRVIGLAVIEHNKNFAELGVQKKVLLRLEHNPQARKKSPGEAGLFHTAFLLPERSDLARWVQFAAEQSIAITGAADHDVSEAIYLNDPEGNGIEIYADRPQEAWVFDHGMVIMGTKRLDLEALLAVGQGSVWQGFPEGGTIGHVHLQVGELEKAKVFYADILGMDVMCQYTGANFFSWGGYHHHIATNIWNSRGAGVRQQPVTGLRTVELRTSSEGLIEDIYRRSLERSYALAKIGDSLVLDDAWGNNFTCSKV